jgi:hypothetical protein
MSDAQAVGVAYVLASSIVAAYAIVQALHSLALDRRIRDSQTRDGRAVELRLHAGKMRVIH